MEESQKRLREVFELYEELAELASKLPVERSGAMSLLMTPAQRARVEQLLQKASKITPQEVSHKLPDVLLTQESFVVAASATPLMAAQHLATIALSLLAWYRDEYDRLGILPTRDKPASGERTH